jgi:hypothetical protein
MAKKVVILGASLGGLIAAAELRNRGHEVSIVERGRTVGGLYNKAVTPFGVQELGMHVLYVNDVHFRHLCDIFGKEVFHTLHGHYVDIGASANFGRVYFDSHYPSLLDHPLRSSVLGEVLAREEAGPPPANALEEAERRFGPMAANAVIAPILRKLWCQDPADLSPNALHCFFDLRRMVLCDKEAADRLKSAPRLDDVIANPVQSMPAGRVFGGRIGLTFRDEYSDLPARVDRWAAKAGITLRFGEDVGSEDGVLMLGGKAIRDDFDACIVAVPPHLLADGPDVEADRLELSICYFQLSKRIANEFPSYYILAQDSKFKASRVVNYDAYSGKNKVDEPSVIAIESVHLKAEAPNEAELVAELGEMLPALEVVRTHRLPRSVGLFAPSLRNARLLDEFQQQVAQEFGGKPIYFSGMRTDTGIFFSHHTIGLAYDTALACHERLAAY